jgi:hypothetical protein
MSSYQEHDHPFYGEEIVRDNQQAHINNLLKKYENEPVNEDLKKKIWDDLQMEKYYGRITIPFKVILKRDINGLYPDYIEVILDTKV